MNRTWTAGLAVLALGSSLRADDLIRLKARAVDPLRIAGPVRPAASGRHLLIQFSERPGPGIQDELKARGIRVLGYVPDSALMVSLNDAADLEGLALRWAGALEAADKLSPALLELNSGSAYVVEFYPDVAAEAARELVRASGLDLLEHPDLLPGQLLATGPYERVAALAVSDEVSYVLPASADLVAGNRVLACAGAETEFGAVAEYVKVGKGWTPDMGGGVSVQYAFTTITPKVAAATARAEFARAFQEWAKYANVNLSEGADPGAKRTLGITFASGAHGDAYAFDGPGVVLAHTYYPAPPNAEPAAGDMHFDADEDWHIGANLDVYTVALHEAGHALGLGHSDRPGSVMYPYYRFGTVMSDDDIAGIRDLYGSRDSQPAGAGAPDVETPGTELPGTGLPAIPPTTPLPAPSEPNGDLPPVPPVPPSQPSQPQPSLPVLPPTADAPQTPASPPSQPPATPPSQPPSTPTQPPPATPQPSADKTPPSLRIVSPGVTIVSTAAASIGVQGTAKDNVGVSAVKWATSSGGSGAAAGTVNWSATVPLLEGTNVITIRAFDAAGNSGWRSVTAVRR